MSTITHNSTFHGGGGTQLYIDKCTLSTPVSGNMCLCECVCTCVQMCVYSVSDFVCMCGREGIGMQVYMYRHECVFANV